jgi:alkylation response protein AidB-like acyl-CoA dehydrogenase
MSGAISSTELRESIHVMLEAESGWSLIRGEADEQVRARADLWQKMASLGWLGIVVPEQYGGLGLDVSHLSLLYEELGQFLTPLPVTATLLCAQALLLAGTDAQKSRWLPPLAQGELRASLVLPTAAVDLPRLGDDRTLRGDVHDVLDGDRVDVIFVPAEDSAGRLHLAIVGKEDPGVQISPHPVIDLTRGLAQVRFADAPIDAERLLPLDAATWTALLDHASLAIASDAAGGATRILADTVAYLGIRRQFDRPIGAFQALKHRAASWKIAVEAVCAFTRHCADSMREGDAASSAAASAAKASATETYVKVAGDAVQLHGGIGFTWEHECHLFLKRAMLDVALFGSLMQHKDRAAELGFDRGLGPRSKKHAQVAVQRFFSRPD